MLCSSEASDSHATCCCGVSEDSQTTREAQTTQSDQFNTLLYVGPDDGQTSSPEFLAFTKAKPELVEQLCFSFLQLKDQCLAERLITYAEVQANFGGRGVTPAGETAILLEIVLSRIKMDPSLYSKFVSLSVLQDPAHGELVNRMGKCLML